MSVPSACPDCGYDRRGLEHGRACPECGGVPRADVVVVWGRAAARHLTVRPRWSTILIVGGIALVGYFGLIFWARSTGRVYVEVAASLAMAVAGFGAVGLTALRARATGRRAGGPVQLRLSDEGYSLRPGYGPAAWRPWPRRVRVRVGRDVRDRATVVAERPVLWPVPGWRLTDVLFAFAPDDGRAAARELADEVWWRAKDRAA